jgi:hypothetical protein
MFWVAGFDLLYSLQDIEYDKELFEYTTRKKLWFMYKDGHLEEINREKFIKNNGGKAW